MSDVLDWVVISMLVLVAVWLGGVYVATKWLIEHVPWAAVGFVTVLVLIAVVYHTRR